MASLTRELSTMLNGQQVDEAQFRKRRRQAGEGGEGRRQEESGDGAALTDRRGGKWPGRRELSRPFSRREARKREAIMSIRLYGWPNSTAARVHWALEELGVSYEYVTLDQKKGENKTPEYLAINPTGKVPGLVDGGQAYFESAAIIIHLGETYGRERGLWPARSAGAARAEALCWTVWGTTELHAYMMQWLYHGAGHGGLVRARRSQQGDRRLQPPPVPAHARRARRAPHRPRLHPGRRVLARRHPRRVVAARGLDLGGSIEGRKNVAGLARSLPRPARVRPDRRRGVVSLELSGI